MQTLVSLISNDDYREFLTIVALLPFSSDSRGTKFTSNNVRSTLRFGYTYPEISGNVSVSAVKRAINKLYGSNASAGGPLERATQAASKQAVDSSPGKLSDGCLRQYTANIVSQKFAMNGSYAIYLFLGDFEQDPSTWPLSKNLAGTHAVAASLASVDTVNARLAAFSTVKVTGAVPLTDSLVSKVQAGELASMNTSTVEVYLRENLKWRVATVSNAGTLGHELTLTTCSLTQRLLRAQTLRISPSLLSVLKYSLLLRTMNSRNGGISPKSRLHKGSSAHQR